MERKRRMSVVGTQNRSEIRHVRLELSPEDHGRIERLAKRKGLSLSSYLRLALFERMAAEEARLSE